MTAPPAGRRAAGGRRIVAGPIALEEAYRFGEAEVLAHDALDLDPIGRLGQGLGRGAQHPLQAVGRRRP